MMDDWIAAIAAQARAGTEAHLLDQGDTAVRELLAAFGIADNPDSLAGVVLGVAYAQQHGVRSAGYIAEWAACRYVAHQDTAR